MKKCLKLLLAFALIFVLAFNSVKAQEGGGGEGGEEPPVVSKITTAPVVKIKANGNTLTLSWAAVENATSYKIERSTDSKKGYKVIASDLVENTYADKKLTYGTKYYYKVTAINSLNKKTSEVVSKKVVPNKITNVTLKQSGSTKVKVSWDQTNNSGYYIFRSTDGKNWSKIKTIKDKTTVKFTDSKLKSNKNYYYQVQAYQKVGSDVVTGSKSDSLKIKTAPAAPELKFYSDDIESFRIRIAQVKGATEYEFYYYNEETEKWEYDWAYLSEWFNDGYYYAYQYVDEPYHTYKYKVRACRNDVCGSYTEISGQAKLSKPAIYGLRAEKKAVHVYFGYNWDADGTEIYRATSKDGNYKKIKTIKYSDSGYSNHFKDTGVSADKTYYYKIRTYGTVNGEKKYSSYSGIRSVKTGKDAGVNSAYEDAKRINKDWYYSKQGIIDILVNEYGYKKADATKGVEKCKIDFKDNALKLAKRYVLYSSAITKKGLKYSLINYHGFTEAEAKYAVGKINIDSHQLLIDNISDGISYGYGYGRQYYIDEYTDPYAGFTEEEVVEVLDSLNINFYEVALNRLNLYYEDNNPDYYCVSRATVKEDFANYKFTEDETEYAFENANDYDFVACAKNDYEGLEYNYGDRNYYSKAEVIETLTSEQYDYTEEEVNAALTSLDVDFNEIALGRANKLLGENYISAAMLRALLGSYEFTEEEVEYAMLNIDADFGFNAYMRLLSKLDSMQEAACRVTFTSHLGVDLGFTDEDIEYAFSQVTEDEWIQMAEDSIVELLEYNNTENNMGLNANDITTIMIEDYYFTNDEVSAALENLSIDFAEQALISAKKFVAEGTFSKESLINLLVSSGYSEEDATTAANDSSIDYGEECVEYILDHYIGEENPGSLENIISDLAAYGFSEDDINYAVEKTDLESYLD